MNHDQFVSSTSAESPISRRRFHRLTLGATIAGLGSPLVLGCGSQTKPASAGIQDIKLAMIAKSNSNPVFQAAKNGWFTRADELTNELDQQQAGTVTVDFRAPNDEDAQQQAQLIEQLTAGETHGIAIACSDASRVTKAIDQAVQRGTVVMCFDSDAPQSKRLCYVGTDDREAGRQVMSETLKLLGERSGEVAILAGNQTATNLQQRVKGAQEVFKKQASDKLSLHGVIYNKETPQDAFAEVESVQKAHNIVGWAMIGGWPLMREAPMPWEPWQPGQPGEVVCVSMDTLPAQLQQLRDGYVQVLLGQQYWQFGQNCVDILFQKIRNDKDPQKTVEFLSLDRVTRDNVDDYAVQAQVWQKDS